MNEKKIPSQLLSELSAHWHFCIAQKQQSLLSEASTLSPQRRALTREEATHLCPQPSLNWGLIITGSPRCSLWFPLSSHTLLQLQTGQLVSKPKFWLSSLSFSAATWDRNITPSEVLQLDTKVVRSETVFLLDRCVKLWDLVQNCSLPHSVKQVSCSHSCFTHVILQHLEITWFDLKGMIK